MNVFEIFKEPVKREELSKIFGCSDREARRIVENLQKNYNIINLQDGRGYFLANDREAERYARQEMSRALKIFEKANGILRRTKHSEGIKIPVRAHLRCLPGKDIKKDENQIKWEI